MTTESHLETAGESHEAEAFDGRESQPAHWFRPGDPRAIEAGKKGGRPKKGESALDVLRREVDRRGPKMVDGLLSRAEKGDTRAFVAAFDRTFGVPATKLIVSRDDDPMLRWLEAMTGQVVAADSLAALPALPPPSPAPPAEPS